MSDLWFFIFYFFITWEWYTTGTEASQASTPECVLNSMCARMWEVTDKLLRLLLPPPLSHQEGEEQTKCALSAHSRYSANVYR